MQGRYSKVYLNIFYNVKVKLVCGTFCTPCILKVQVCNHGKYSWSVDGVARSAARCQVGGIAALSPAAGHDTTHCSVLILAYQLFGVVVRGRADRSQQRVAIIRASVIICSAYPFAIAVAVTVVGASEEVNTNYTVNVRGPWRVQCSPMSDLLMDL